MSEAVTLAMYELAHSTNVGRIRALEALRQGRPEALDTPAGNFEKHINGAPGEQAAAKCLNVYWSGSVNTFRIGGDVGKWQVRTRSKPHFELYVRESDRDGDIFILVRGKMPKYDVVGWMYGKDAKRSEWLQDHGGYGKAYFVPDAALRPVAELRRLLHGES